MLLPARTLRVSLATAAAALAVTAGLVGCSSDDNKSDATVSSSSAAAASASSSATPSAAASAPTPETLQAVLVKLSDPAVPTADKAKLIVDGEKRTANIDQMNKGLAGYALTFAVADVTVQGNSATAQVTINSPHGAAPAMPITWENVGGTWKLSDQSGCLLLGFAQAPCVPA